MFFVRKSVDKASSTIAPRRDKQSIVFITSSFSTESGGRVASIFQRAKLFADMGYQVYIAALHYRPNFPDVFQKTCKKYGLKNARFLSPFEFYCKGNPFKSPNAGKTQSAIVGQTEKTHDDSGRIYRIKYLQKKSNDIVMVEYYDPNTNEPFLIVNSDEMHKASRFFWLRSASNEPGCFFNRHQFVSYWISNLEHNLNHPIFFSEFHSVDSALVENPYVNHRLRTVVTIHSSFFKAPYTYGSPLRTYNSKVLDRLDLYDAVICLTEQERQHAFNYYGPRDHVYRIAHPIAPTLDTAISTIDRNANKIIVVSRLISMKRVDHIIRAMKIIQTRIPSVRLDIYGEGDSQAELNDLADTLGLADAVEFKGYTNNPLQAFATGALSVATSEFEGFSLSILESLAVGTPVVSYDFLYGPKELIEDGVNGRLVPNGNIDKLAQILADLLSDPASIARMSLAAKALPEKLTIPHIRAQWSSVFANIEALHLSGNPPVEEPATSTVLVDFDTYYHPSFGKSVLLISAHHYRRPANRYYLNFNEKKGAELSDKLYLEGKVLQSNSESTYIIFNCAIEPVYERLLNDVSLLYLDISCGRESTRYEIEKNSISKIPQHLEKLVTDAMASMDSHHT